MGLAGGLAPRTSPSSWPWPGPKLCICEGATPFRIPVIFGKVMWGESRLGLLDVLIVHPLSGPSPVWSLLTVVVIVSMISWNTIRHLALPLYALQWA